MDYIKITPGDNVAVALTALCAGQTSCGVTLTEDIPAGHKFALTEIPTGADVIKYGAPIGHAEKDIPAGAWVHTHNVKTGLSDVISYEYHGMQDTGFSSLMPPDKQTFRGYRRRGDRAGIRNEIWIVPTVGCINSVAETLAKEAAAMVRGSVDGVYAWMHPYGCSQLGGDHRMTQDALAGLIHHPNAGGVLVLGLGCENNNIGELKKVLGETDPARVRFLNCQETDDEIEAGLSVLEDLIGLAAVDEREDIPVSALVVGMKCGGSDGFSGITANPCVGVFSDMLCAAGGTTILTEVPEMFGAEQLLMERCPTKDLFDKTVSLVNGFKRYYQRYGQPIYENPAPGNKAGGITTLEDKSLGCTQKAGTSPVCGVLSYGERVTETGLHLLSAPGNDLVAATALAVSGAQLILFTTGRGTPFGSPVPTVKISSNTPLAEKKPHWIDFDAGIIAKTGDIASRGRELYDYVLRLASGELRTKNEEHGYRDISIFRDGVTL
ncbi:MAG: altronate dehydratase [Clostridia bacterium]|nr:altronate dehydratase [Clostridia bacterium]